MSQPDPKPTNEQLQRFLSGTLAERERQLVEQYVEQLPFAIETLREITIEPDTLVLALGRAEYARSVAANLQGLIDSAKKLSATRGELATCEKFAVPAADPRAPIDWSNLLDPPKQQDELCRLGDYRLLRVIGQGGMGVVFEADDPRLHRQLAVKVIHPRFAADALVKERFLREARAAAAVEHDHTIAIHQVGEVRGLPFVAMPLLQGESLETKLSRLRFLTAEDVIRLGRDVSAGLMAAHARGLIHRDIKPGNIWLDERTGRAIILDFGLARAKETEQEPGLTHTGTIVGTPSYMAPEQAESQPLDARSDLFSLGCVLYRAATGELPFPGETPLKVLSSLANRIPPRIDRIVPELPTLLGTLVTQLLSKQPSERPASAAVVVLKFDELLVEFENKGRTAQQTATREPALAFAPPPAKKWRMVAIAALACLLMLVLTLGPSLATILLFVSNRGELAIQIEDPEIEVTVRQDGVEVYQKSTHRKFVVRPVGGEVEFFDPESGAIAVTKSFALKRAGERTSVTVTAREIASARPNSTSVEPSRPVNKKTLPDPSKSFVILRGERPVAEYAFCPASLPDYREGDVIEVRGDGPFKLPQLDLHQGFCLQAAYGSHPVFVPAPDLDLHASWVIVRRGRLVIKGCEFRLPGGIGNAVFEAHGEACEISNSTLVRGERSQSPVLILNCPQAQISDSFLVYPFGLATIQLLDRLQILNLHNNLLWGQASHALFVARREEPLTVRCERNTVICDGALVAMQALEEDRPTIVATGRQPISLDAICNVFAGQSDLLQWGGNELTLADRSRLVQLRGKNNVVRSRVDLEHVSNWAMAVEAGLTDQPSLLFQWERIWQSPMPLAERLRCLRDVLEPGLPHEGEPVGPNWDLIGPGPGYLKTLPDAEQQDQSPPDPLEGGVFTLLHPGAPDRGISQLDAAVRAASDDDVIELRTNGPTTAYLHRETPGRRLTLHAAQGYQPEFVDLKPFDAGAGHRWTLVNLMLRGQLNNQLQGCVKTLQNCAWVAYEPTFDVFSMALSSRSEAGPDLQVVNCVIPGRTHVDLAQGRKAVFQNSILGGLRVFSEPPEVKHQKLEFDRCAFWTWSPQHTLQFLYIPGNTGAELKAWRCIFEGAYMGGIANDNWRWSGDHNQFRLWMHNWTSDGGGGGSLTRTLGDWQRLWDSDGQSTEFPSLKFDPWQWRIVSPAELRNGNVGVDFTQFHRPAALR